MIKKRIVGKFYKQERQIRGDQPGTIGEDQPEVVAGDEELLDDRVSIDEEDLSIDLIGDDLDLVVLRNFKRFFAKFQWLFKSGAVKKDSRITITICTNGGDYRVGLAINNLIIASNLPVTTVALGAVGSAGLAIFFAGQERLTYPSSLFFFHRTQPVADSSDSREQVERELVRDSFIDKVYNSLLPVDSRLTRKRQRKLELGESFITAEEAVKYGLAHEIIQNR